MMEEQQQLSRKSQSVRPSDLDRARSSTIMDNESFITAPMKQSKHSDYKKGDPYGSGDTQEDKSKSDDGEDDRATQFGAESSYGTRSTVLAPATQIL